MSKYVAFYGTLMSGLPPRAGAPDLSSHVEFVGGCVLSGELWDVGPFPALIAGDGRVQAELWRVISANALDVIDSWEEYQPADEAASLYLRRRVSLLLPRDVKAWTYEWNGPLKDARRIGGGDWRAHTAARGSQR